MSPASTGLWFLEITHTYSRPPQRGADNMKIKIDANMDRSRITRRSVTVEPMSGNILGNKRLPCCMPRGKTKVDG